MTTLSYSVTESIYRQHHRIVKLVYDYEENPEELEVDPPQQLPKYRHYRATIKRDEYERSIESYLSAENRLSFDKFVCILRPIMMGTYDGNELRDAFVLLDKNQSNTINLDELVEFLSIIYPDVTKDILLHYVGKHEIYTDEKLNFDEFNDLILRGIGKDIVCGHI